MRRGGSALNVIDLLWKPERASGSIIPTSIPVVWFHSSQTFRDLTPAEQPQLTINRKLWQSKKIAVVTAAPQLGDLGGSVKGNSRAKVPTAAETGAVAINPVCTPDRHLARVKNVRRQSLQRLPRATFASLPVICLDAPMDHPTVRKSTHPSLPGKRKATATVTSETDRINGVLFEVVSSSSSGEGMPTRPMKVSKLDQVDAAPPRIITFQPDQEIPDVASSSTTIEQVDDRSFLNIEESDDNDGEALLGLLPYSPGLPREPKASEKTVSYIQRYGAAAALDKVLKSALPRILTEAELYYYRTGYGLIEQTLRITENLKSKWTIFRCIRYLGRCI